MVVMARMTGTGAWSPGPPAGAPIPASSGFDAGTALTSELFADARILIVDDVDANVFVLERMLRAAGAKGVESLTDPRLVAQRCLEWQPDLILLDLHMPDLDGVAVLQMLKATLPADSFIPVLMLTADSTSTAKQQALAAGAKDFLTKPLDRTEVLLRVHNLLQTRALYTRVKQDQKHLQAELDRKLAHEQRLDEQRRTESARIREVLRGDALTMVFQPVVELDNAQVVGVESLSRFRGPPRRPPNEWFAEAENVGLGVQLELLAIERALAQLEQIPPGCFMSLNVSPTTAIAPELRTLLATVPGRSVVLELTEHVRIRDYEVLWPAFDELRGQGVRIAVDDAGAGYAGLQHILRLRPDVLKLDHDLTLGIHRDPARRALAAAMATFAGELGATLVAEGIEFLEDLEVLHGIGVPWGQGYLLGHPGPLPLPNTRRVLTR
jgi:EAL domain-containing protein (putative c-di-GMP-specific phosphodiesterase class I)